VISTLHYFLDEYEEHINERRCPAGVCEMDNVPIWMLAERLRVGEPTQAA
jgi:bidirectional [NiFe] hydrogenase diaphorase subunit